MPVPVSAAAASGDPGRVDHGAGEAVLGGFVAELQDLGAGGVGFEQGMVEDGGKVLRGREGVGGEGCGVEAVRDRWKRIRDGEGAQKCSFGDGEVRAAYFLSYCDENWSGGSAADVR